MVHNACLNKKFQYFSTLKASFLNKTLQLSSSDRTEGDPKNYQEHGQLAGSQNDKLCTELHEVLHEEM